MRHALPFDPGARATTTDSLQVGMVRRVDTGEVLDVEDWIPSQTLGQIHALRPDLRQRREAARFVCFCCGHPVLLKKHANGGHFFAHKEKGDAEKAGCLYQDGRSPGLADIDRLRYQGQREGARHRRTKDLIARILRADARFAEPVIEQVWTSFSDGWRKPDVASKWDGLPVVFEAQVSNTYPQIVAERTVFYRDRGALLVWIFDQLPDSAWRTLHADTFCANQQHLFVVDEECVAESERTGRAHLRCYSQRPDVEVVQRPSDGRIVLQPTLVESFKLVAWDQLTLNAERQTACQFEVAEDMRRARHKVLCSLARADYRHNDLATDICSLLGRQFPISASNIEGWAALVCAIEARRLNMGVGTKYVNTVGGLNLVHDHHPHFFPHLVTTLDRIGLDPEVQRTGAWAMRVNEFHKGRYFGGEIPPPHAGSEQLLKWLYPE